VVPGQILLGILLLGILLPAMLGLYASIARDTFLALPGGTLSMAESGQEDGAADKTEEATPRRLEKATGRRPGYYLA